MFTAMTNPNSRPAASSRAQRCTNVVRGWLDTAEVTAVRTHIAAGTYFTGIKHPAWRPPEEPM